MIKLDRFKKYILPLLLCMSSSVFAEHKGFYGFLRKSSGVIVNNIKDLQTCNGLSDSESEPEEKHSELNILHQQLSSIINQGKTSHPELRKKVWDIFSFSAPEYGSIEAGVGYYFQLVMPFALEVKALGEHTQNVWYLFYSGAFKVFLPLGTRTKLYAKVGKSFHLNYQKPSDSIISMNDEVLDDIKETVWHKTPQQQWQLSRTFCAIGAVRKISSKLELDFSAEGYTPRDCKTFYFTTSLGVNYLF